MTRYLPILVLLAGSGCVSPEQAARNREAGDIAYTQALAGQCESLGYTRQTDQWRQCIVQLHTSIQNQPVPAPIPYRSYRTPPRQPTQTNCTRDPWGNISCTTY